MAVSPDRILGRAVTTLATDPNVSWNVGISAAHSCRSSLRLTVRTCRGCTVSPSEPAAVTQSHRQNLPRLHSLTVRTCRGYTVSPSEPAVVTQSHRQNLPWLLSSVVTCCQYHSPQPTLPAHSSDYYRQRIALLNLNSVPMQHRPSLLSAFRLHQPSSRPHCRRLTSDG